MQWEPRRPPAGADPMQGAFFRMLQEVVPSLATRWWAFNVRHRYREDVALLAQRMLPPGVWDHLPPADQRGYLDRLMQGYDAWNAGTRAIAYHGTLDEADFRAAFGGLMPATTTTAGAASLSPSVPPAAVPPEVASPVPPADDDAPPPGRFSRLA